jgi:peptidyl-prolyl cis-trans isomerase SurA
MNNIRINFLKFASLAIFFSIFINLTLYSYEIKIIKKIGREIVTNIDVMKEYQYLVALNEKFEDTKEDQILDISKQSIINEKIKKNEILKLYILGKGNEDLINNIIKDIYLRLSIDNKNEFEEYLKNYNLTYKEIYDKIEIEIVWNQLIYSKYKNQININKKLIKEKVQSIKEERISYNLSEIILLDETKSKILNKYEETKIYINELGFEKTAILYSQADSKSKGGVLGWVYEDQLSDSFKKELKNLEINQITNPLNISGGILILKINDIKIETKEINLEEAINNNVKFETEKQLNNFSLIYFNKIKKTLLDE